MDHPIEIGQHPVVRHAHDAQSFGSQKPLSFRVGGEAAVMAPAIHFDDELVYWRVEIGHVRSERSLPEKADAGLLTF